MKLIVFDLDGTLLTDDKIIGEVNFEAIKLAMANGYQIVLASGRPHSLMLPYAKQLGVTTKLICCNGAYVYDQSLECVTNEVSIPGQELKSLLSLISARNLPFTLYSDSGLSSTSMSEHIRGLVANAALLGVDLDVEIHDSIEACVNRVNRAYKVLVTSSDESELQQLKADLKGRFSAEQSEPNKLDICSIFADKGFSLKKIAAESGADLSQSVAFGDGENDKGMLGEVYTPIAMSNASSAVKSVSDAIVTDNNGAGIGQFIRLMVSNNY